MIKYSDMDYTRGVPTSNWGNQMPPVNTVNDYSQWGDITETMSRLTK